MEESHEVEGLLEFSAAHLIVNECLLRQQVQVLLEGLCHKVALQSSEDAYLSHRALQERQHAPGDANDGEMVRFVQVVSGGPSEDLPHRARELLIFVSVLGVSGDVKTIQVLKLS